MAISAGVPLIVNGASTSPQSLWPGGVGVFTVVGAFGGATITLQYLAPDGVTWITPGAQTTLTAAGGGLFYLHTCQIRALVTGGPPSGIYAEADRVVY